MTRLLRCLPAIACFFAALGPSLVTTSAQEQSGVQWSGFQNGGNCSVDATLPTVWSPEENIVWSAQITGYGQSTPVVAGEQVVVTSTAGENKDRYYISAFDVATGGPCWQKEYANPTPEKNTTYVSRAAASPAVDGKHIYAFFEGGLVAAVTHSGEAVWQRNLVDEYGPISARHGLASSVEQNADRLFVWIERSDNPYVLALDKDTGETIWKTVGAGATTWSSPRLVTVQGGKQHLVCSASGKVIGLSPENGDQMWVFDGIANNSSCTPIPLAEGRFLIGASDGRGEDSDGKGAESNGVIAIKRDGDTWSARFQWQAEKATSTFGSPVVHQDSVYFVNRVGVLYTMSLASGESIAAKRTKAGGIWATPLVADGKLYLFGSKGVTSVIDLATGNEAATNTLWQAEKSKEPKGTEGQAPAFGGPVLYAAAVSPPYLLLRRGDTLYAVAEQSK